MFRTWLRVCKLANSILGQEAGSVLRSTTIRRKSRMRGKPALEILEDQALPSTSPTFIPALAHLREYPLITNGGPDWVTSGPDGNIWFNASQDFTREGAPGYIGRITPSGVVTEFPLAIGTDGIISGPHGNLWFGDGTNIAEMTTDGVILHEYPVLSPAFSSPHLGPDGDVWYSQPYENNVIGRMTPDGQATEIPLNIADHVAGIADAVAGPDGNMWFEATGVPEIGRVNLPLDPDPLKWVTYFPLPGIAGPVRGLAVGSDGDFWMTTGNEVLRVNTAGQITGTFNIPTPNSGAYLMTKGADGALWFTESNVGQIGRITTDGVITEFLVSPNDQSSAITTGADGNIWFGENNLDQIGEFVLTHPTPQQPPVATQVYSLNFPKTFDLGAFTDDAAESPWTVQVDWGDNSLPDTITQLGLPGNLSEVHGYSTSGNHTVTETVTNKDGLIATTSWLAFDGSLVLTPSAATITQGDTFTLSGSFADPDPNEARTVVITWGDNTPSTTVLLPANTLAFSANHQYLTVSPRMPFPLPSPGFPISVTITGLPGDVISGGVGVNVNPAPPVLTPPPDQTSIGNLGLPINLGSFAAAAGNGPWTVHADYGDGTLPATFTVTASGNLTAIHPFAALGNLPVTVTVTDSYGGSATASFHVMVNSMVVLNTGDSSDLGSASLRGAECG